MGRRCWWGFERRSMPPNSLRLESRYARYLGDKQREAEKKRDDSASALLDIKTKRSLQFKPLLDGISLFGWQGIQPGTRVDFGTVVLKKKADPSVSGTVWEF